MAQSIIQTVVPEFMFFAKLGAKGQQEFIGTGSTTFTVPAGVSLLSAVCIGYAAVVISGAGVCSSGGPYGLVGDGGGNGGPGGAGGYADISPSYPGAGGGGGCGGYSGDGGSGGYGAFLNEFTGTWVAAVPGGNGAGGGGGGGGGGPQGVPQFQNAGPGGGVGLLGIGSSGSGGAIGQQGNPGSNSSNNLYGGGKPGASYIEDGFSGSNLRYKNNISVTAGQTITIYLAQNPNTASPSAVRVIWGGGRSYPSNAGNV